MVETANATIAFNTVFGNIKKNNIKFMYDKEFKTINDLGDIGNPNDDISNSEKPIKSKKPDLGLSPVNSNSLLFKEIGSFDLLSLEEEQNINQRKMLAAETQEKILADFSASANKADNKPWEYIAKLDQLTANKILKKTEVKAVFDEVFTTIFEPAFATATINSLKYQTKNTKEKSAAEVANDSLKLKIENMKEKLDDETTRVSLKTVTDIKNLVIQTVFLQSADNKSKEQFFSAEKDFLNNRNQLVEANLKLVAKQVKTIIRQHSDKYANIDFSAVYSWGVEGLVRAADRFDGRVKFASYAVPIIKNMIQRYHDESAREIRLPNNLIDKLGKYFIIFRDKKREFPDKSVSELNDMIAGEIQMTVKEIEELSLLPTHSMSLNNPLGDDGEKEHIDNLPSESADSLISLTAKEDKNVIIAKVSQAINELQNTNPGNDKAIMLFKLHNGVDLGKEELEKFMKYVSEQTIKSNSLESLKEKIKALVNNLYSFEVHKVSKAEGVKWTNLRAAKLKNINQQLDNCGENREKIQTIWLDLVREKLTNSEIVPYDSLTLKEIGDFLSIGRERVRQIEEPIIAKLKEVLAFQFKEYLDSDGKLTI